MAPILPRTWFAELRVAAAARVPPTRQESTAADFMLDNALRSDRLQLAQAAAGGGSDPSLWLMR